MNTFDGYIRRNGTNSKVLLDGGNAKALSEFIGTISYANNKITYTKADGTSYDLINLSNYIYNLGAATSDNLGGIKIGFSQSGKNYPVQLDANNKAYVYVPWEENSHYTTKLYVGDGTAENKITTNGNTRITVTDNNNVRNYITLIGSGATNVSSDDNGKITINSTNTTYNTGDSATLNKGTNTEGKLWSAKTLVDYISDILGVDSTAITSLNTLIGQLHDNDTATGILVELAKKLNTPSSSIGSNNQPIYWNGSSFTIIGYTIEKSVPSNAIFTDTKYSFYVGENNNIKEHKNVSNPYFKLFENNTPTSIQIKAGTGISVSSDTNGNITIKNESPDQNHNTWRPIKIEGTEKLGSTTNTDALNLTAGNGIEVSYDSTNKKVIIKNTKPDQNHDTHYTTSMYIGENNDTKANKAVNSPYFKLFDNDIRRSTIRFVAGSGIGIASDDSGNITITNSSPDQNHNTDKTGIKLGTISGTKKTDSTVIINNSSTGLTIAGGTNKFSIGDGTNYIEIPITPSFTVTNKDSTIGTSLTTIATIAGTDIKAKIGSYLPLSGGTMTGHLTIKTSSYRDQLTIYRNENNNNSVINFSNKDGFLGAIGFTGLLQTGMPEKPHVVLKDGTLYTLLHSGNTSISNGTITINGTSITPITSLSYYPTKAETVLDLGGSITSTIYSLGAKRVFSGLNLTDAPVQGWVSGLVLGSNWNNNHYQHYLVEANDRWYTTRYYENSKMKSWNTFAYISDIPTKVSQLTNDSGYLTSHQSLPDMIKRHDTENQFNDTAGLRVITVAGDSTLLGSQKYGSVIQWSNANYSPSTVNSGNWYNQLMGLTDDRLYFRTRTNGNNWTNFHKVAWTSDIPTKSSWNYDDVYLKLSGGTLSGYLTISGGSSHAPLIIKGGFRGYRHNIQLIPSHNWSGILFGANDVTTEVGNTTTNSYWVGNNNGAFSIAKGGSGNASISLYCNGTDWYVNTKKIYHTGNLPAYPTKESWNYDDRYLKLSTGGTVLGTTTFKTDSYGTQLEIYRNTNNGNPSIKFNNPNSITNRYIGFETSRNEDNAFYFTDNNATNKYYVASEEYVNNLYNSLLNGYADSAGNADMVDNYHAFDIGKAGWVNVGAQNPKKYYKIATISLNGTWAATFIIDTSGDLNYCNYAHGKLTISCYEGSSFSVTLLSGPDYNETIYAYIDSSFNVWLAHDNLYAGFLRWKCIFNNAGNNLTLYTSNINSQQTEPSSYKITSNGAYHYVKSNNTFYYNGKMYNNTNASYPIIRNVNLQGNASTASNATYANYLNIVASNEIRFNNIPSSSIQFYFNYVWAGGIADDKIVDYRFMNGNRGYAGIVAEQLSCTNGYIYLHGPGSSTYDLSSIFSNSYGLTIETPRATNAQNGTVLPLMVKTRGGQWSELQTGTIVANGNVTATAFYASSDLRLKNILTHPNYSAEQLASLPLVKYTWKDKENDSIHLGSIAQDVERIIPEVVNIDNEGYKSLDYATLGAIGVISLAREIVELKKEINELKSKLYG